MSDTIDKKTVEMKFDNTQFESKMKSTIGLLGKFKEGLKFKGATAGINEVSKSAGRFNMTPMADAVQSVQAHFSTMEVVAVTTIANITNSAVNYAKRMAKALTIDPISSGLKEYETQINSVQTILANTSKEGTSLTEVTRALDELNLYADRTIYNFTEMTRNIGTFTAAGVKLDTSVSAIKGIANLAAVSGSNAQQASTAMYQLSQALSTGTVKLMDWNSIVNAGMGGKVFQDALTETAKVHGVAVDEMIKSEGSFRETLQNGWLTSDILTETLDKFTGDMSASQLKQLGYTEEQITEIEKLGKMANDAATKVKTWTQLIDTLKEAAQSGWSQSWKLIIGDFDEAKHLFTQVSDSIGGMISNMSDKRNKLLEGGLSSGWDKFLNLGIADGAGYEDKISQIAKKSGIDLDKMIEKEGSFKETLKSGWLTADMMKKGLSDLAEETQGLSKEKLKETGYTEEEIASLQKLNADVQNGTVDINEYAESLTKMSGRQHIIEGLRNVFTALVSVISPIHKAFEEMIPAMTGKNLYDLTVMFEKFTKRLTLSKSSSKDLENTFKGVFKIVDVFRQALKLLFKLVGPVITIIGVLLRIILKITGAIGNFIVALLTIGEQSKVFDILTNAANNFSDTISDIIDFITKVLSNSTIITIATAIGTGISKAFSGVAEVLDTITKKMETKISKGGVVDILGILNSLIAGGVFVVFAKFIKNLSSNLDDLSGTAKKFVGDLTSPLTELKEVLVSYQLSIRAKTLILIAQAVMMLSGSLWLLSTISADKLDGALKGLTAILVEIMISFVAFSKVNVKSATKGISVLLAVSSAVLLLSIALKTISTIKTSKLLASVTALGVIMGMITVMAFILSASSKKHITMMKGAMQLIIIAAAINILVIAVKKLSKINYKDLGKGLIGVGILLGSILLFLKYAKLQTETGGAIATATSMLVMAGAIYILAEVTKKLGNIKRTDLEKGLGAIIVLMSYMVGFSFIMSNTKSMISTSISMGILSVALLGMAIAMTKIAEIKTKDIVHSLTAIGATLLLFAVSLNFMKTTLGGSLALAVAISSLTMLIPVLTVLGAMSWKSIAKGIVGLAGALIILVAAASAAQAVWVGLLAISVTFTAIGISLAAAGAGITALSIGLAALATVSVVSAKAIVKTMTILAEGIVTLIPVLAKALADSIVAFVAGLADGATTIVKSVITLIKTISEAIIMVAPTIVKTLLTILVMFLEQVVTYAPKIINSFIDFTIAVIEGIASRVPDISEAMGKLVEALFGSFKDNIAKYNSTDLLTLVATVAGITLLMIGLAALSGLIPAAMVGVLGLGVLIAELTLVIAAVGAISKIPGIMWLINGGGDLLGALGIAIGNFIGGIAGGALATASEALPIVGKNLSDFMTSLKPFIEAASGIDPESMEGVKSLATAILLLTGSSILDSISNWLGGDASFDSFGKELELFGPHIRAFYDSVKDLDPEILRTASKSVATLVGIANDIPNEGGLVSLVTGDNSLDDFGAALEKFATHIVAFASNMSSVDTTVIGSAISNMNKLVTMAHNMKKVDPKTMANFGGALKILGMTGVTQFTNSFKNSKKKVSDAIATMISGATSSIKNKSKSISTSMKSPLEGLLTNIKGYNSKFKSVGEALVKNMITGYKSKSKSFISVNSKMLDAVISNSKKMKTKFETVGKYVVQGLVNGIDNNKSKAIKSAVKMAAESYEAAKKELDIESPSKKFYALGAYSIEGYVNAFKNGIEKVKFYSVLMAKESVTAVAKVTDAELKKASKAMKYGSGALKEGLRQYSKQMGDISTKKKISNMSKVITEYGVQLYKESDAYDTDTASMKTYKKELQKYADRKARLTLELNESERKGSKITDKRVAKIKQGLKDVSEDIDNTQKNISQNIKDVAQHTKDAYHAVRDGLKDSVEGLLDPMSASLDNYVSIFDKFSGGTKITTAAILENMRSQVDGVTEWKADINKLSQKGIATGLLDKLKALGPTGSNYIKTFISMTTDEMEKANAAFSESSDLTAQSLIDNFDTSIQKAKDWALKIQVLTENGLAQDILEKIGKAGAANTEYLDAFLQMTPSQISEFNKKYKESLALPNTVSDSIMASFVVAGDKSSSSFIKALDPIKDGIKAIDDIVPVITPVVDLKNVQEAQYTISSMLSSASASSANPSKSSKSTRNNNSSSNISYTQNIYSPKYVSSTEVYRQTNNQLSALKGGK